MLNLIGEGLAKGTKKALKETAEEVGEKAVAKTAKRTAKEAALDISNKVAQKYGDKADEIMAYYGSDIAKKGDNSFLGRLLSGQKVENPLVMYHSVDSSKLRDMLELADATYSDYAIPNPSVQVVDPTKNVGTSYGDVILLGNKSIPGGINKYSGKPDLYGGKYNLFSRDIYSPRKPNIEWSKGTPTIAGTRKRATPDNISEYMTKQGTKAVEGNWSTPASLAAATSKRFKSPLDAIKNSNLLQSQGGLQRAFNDWDKEVSDSVQTLLDKYMVNNPDVNPYSYSDYIMSELQDAMAGKKMWDDPYGINTTEEGRNIVKNLTSKAKELPTAYFEGKPSRAIPLEEFGGVILPEGFSDTYVDKALKDAGLEIKGWYDPENYEESLQNTLVGLTKGSDRLTTPYLMSKEPSLADMAKNTKAMPDGDIRRIGSADVAPIDPNTLPPSLKAANEYLDEGNFVKDIEKFAGKPYPTLTDDDFLEYSISLKNPKDKDFYRELIGDMVNDGSTTYRKFAASAARDARLNKLRQGDYKDMDVDAFIRYLANHRSQLSDNVSKSIDKELSDRLGIGRSNTFMRDNQVPFDASGVYVPAETALSIKTDVPEEEAVSTLAHERMHSFQNESKIKRYDKRVTDAYNELSKELDKHLRSRDEIAKTYKTDIDYWVDKNEQQSRMLQSYLENAGFTKTGRKPEWGNEIKPAFDKFYDKIRALSKAGVALPAIGLALLLGENYNNKKKEG